MKRQCCGRDRARERQLFCKSRTVTTLMSRAHPILNYEQKKTAVFFFRTSNKTLLLDMESTAVVLDCASLIRLRMQSRQRALLWKVHAEQEVLEARVGAHAIETRIDVQQHQPLCALLVCRFQPMKCLLILSESRVDSRHTIGRYVLLL